MSNVKILTGAIEKAIGSNWLPPSSIWDEDITRNNIIFEVLDGANDVVFGSDVVGRIWSASESIDVARLIYSPEFAKALWGETTSYVPTNNLGHPLYDKCALVAEDGYKYHLQQMVIAEDPIKYLEENL